MAVTHGRSVLGSSVRLQLRHQVEHWRQLLDQQFESLSLRQLNISAAVFNSIKTCKSRCFRRDLRSGKSVSPAKPRRKGWENGFFSKAFIPAHVV